MIARVTFGTVLLPALLCSVLASAQPGAQPVVVVLDYGAEPREALRYAFSAGRTFEGTMSMEMQTTMSMGGRQLPGISIPAVSVPFSMRTTEVLQDGSARYELELGEPTLGEDGDAAPAPAELEGGVAETGTLSGWGRIDARGNMLEGGVNEPSAALDAAGQLAAGMRGQLLQLLAPFPVEPVGVGARWQVSRSTQMMAGASILQTEEYTLLARDGDRVELDVAVVEAVATPPSGPPPPGVPRGRRAAPESISIEGGGEMTVSLSSLVPRGELKVTTSISTVMPAQGESMTTNVQSMMSFSPED